MKIVVALVSWIGGHSTKILGFLTVTVSYLNAEGVIPKGQLKWYTLALGLCTVWRGFLTGNAYDKGVIAGAGYVSSTPFLVLKPSSQTPVEPK